MSKVVISKSKVVLFKQKKNCKPTICNNFFQFLAILAVKISIKFVI